MGAMKLCTKCANEFREAYNVTLKRASDLKKKEKCAKCGKSGYPGEYAVSLRTKHEPIPNNNR